MRFYTNPSHVLICHDTDKTFIDELVLNAKITLRENGLHTAAFTIDNESQTCPYDITSGSLITFQVGEQGETPITIFKGTVNFPIYTIEKTSRAIIECDHIGFALSEMLVANEYGAQSANPSLNILQQILTDSSQGIIPKYVNEILASGTSSGYDISTDYVDEITGTINYVDFPYKPADKCLNDLVDIITALNAGENSFHWIIDHDGALHCKMLDTSQETWPLYYGGEDNTAGQATLNLQEDIISANYEEQTAEANIILYYGIFRRPGNGDSWTESHSGWGSSSYITLSTETTLKAVGNASVKALRNHPTGTPLRWYYPSSKNAAWDFTKFGSPTYIPTLNFMAYRNGLTSLTVYLYTDNNSASRVTLYNSISGPAMDNNTWYSYEIPIGPYWQAKPANTWKWITEASNPVDWQNVNWIEFGLTGTQGEYALIDNLYFGNVPLCRVAWNSNLPESGTAKMKLIVDHIGKDDSLTADDDSGLMAQLAYAELLRLQKPIKHLTVKTNIIPDALPGQRFEILNTEYRALQVIHEINQDGYFTTLHLTDDLTNGRVKPRWEDINRQFANMRPEFQDRQASSMKAAAVDWRVPRLTKNYT